MEDTSCPPGKEPPPEPGKSDDGTKASSETAVEDVSATESGPHVQLELPEDELDILQKIFQGSSFFEDSSLPLTGNLKPVGGSAPETVSNPVNPKLQRWQTMKFNSAGYLKTIKDIEQTTKLLPRTRDEDIAGALKAQPVTSRRESFNNVPQPAQQLPKGPPPRSQQQEVSTSKSGRQSRGSTAKKQSKGGKKAEGVAGGTSGFTDAYPLKFNPLTSKLMDMSAQENHSKCSEKCGNCGHCADSINYRMYVND